MLEDRFAVAPGVSWLTEFYLGSAAWIPGRTLRTGTILTSQSRGYPLPGYSEVDPAPGFVNPDWCKSAFRFGLIVFVDSPSQLCLHYNDHAEASFIALHLGESIGGSLKRHGLNHRADISQDAEGQRVFVVDRGTGQGSLN